MHFYDMRTHALDKKENPSLLVFHFCFPPSLPRFFILLPGSKGHIRL